MSTRALRIAWYVVVMGAIMVYRARFGRYTVGATLFPRLVSDPVLILAGTALLLEGLKVHTKEREGSVSPSSEMVSLRDGAWAVVLGGGYLLLWRPLGFFADTVVLLTAAPLILGYPRKQVAVAGAVGVATALLFSFLFHLGTGAILPRGIFAVSW